MKDKLGNRKGQWAGRRFSREQLLKRDIRSAATRSAKKGIKPTLAPIKLADDPR